MSELLNAPYVYAGPVLGLSEILLRPRQNQDLSLIDALSARGAWYLAGLFKRFATEFVLNNGHSAVELPHQSSGGLMAII